MVSESPNKPYEAVRKTTIEEDFTFVVADLLDNTVKARRIVVYCQSLNMCASLYENFKYTLKDAGYYPPGAEQISDNRMFGNSRRVLGSLTVLSGLCLRRWLLVWGWRWTSRT